MSSPFRIDSSQNVGRTMTTTRGKVTFLNDNCQGDCVGPPACSGSAARLTLVLAIVLTGCVKAPTTFSEFSAQITSEDHRASVLEETPVTRMTSDLWSDFPSALRHAVISSSAYNAALALEAAALADISQASANLKPQLAGGLNTGLLYEGTPTSDATAGVAGSLTAQQLLFDGGAAQGTINLANANALAAQTEREIQANKVALSAAQAWLGLWQYEERLRWLDEKTGELGVLLKQIERMASNGLIDRSALDSAQRQLIDIKLQRVALLAGVHGASARFTHLFGSPTARLYFPQEIYTTKAVEADAVSWMNAPLLTKSLAELASARAEVEVAKAGFKPIVGLKAGVVSPLENGESMDFSVGVSVDYVFGDGGRRKARLEMAESREEAQKQKYLELVREIKASGQVLVQQLREVEASIHLLNDKIKISSSEVTNARTQIATGQSSLRQLIEAEIENYRSRDQMIQMKVKRELLLIEIAAGLGHLDDLIRISSLNPETSSDR